MAQHRDIDDEEEWEEEDLPARRGGPRFGPLFTIAVAILVLFGAASRFGKNHGATGLDALDLSAKTVISLGSKQKAPQPAAQAVLPPSRGEFDLDAYQRQKAFEQYQRQYGEELRSRNSAPPGLSLAMPTHGELENNYDRSGRFDPAPEAVGSSRPKGSSYTVKPGDNWVKIAKATGRNWQAIQRANPMSKDGLTVGMKLVIPEG